VALGAAIPKRLHQVNRKGGACTEALTGWPRLASDAARMRINEPSWIGAVAGEKTRTAIDAIVNARAWPSGQVRVSARAEKYAESIPASSCELTVIRYNPRRGDVAKTERSRHFFRRDGSRVAAHSLA
jgi:hypothetical protein